MSSVTAFLFTDIEGSTRLWEQEPERMRSALARHDAVARAAVADNCGTLVKTTGDGVHAAFSDPRDAIAAALQIQHDLADADTTGGVTLRVRCGIHVGVGEQRDNDFFGGAVNRAARIMSAAHGGQILLSQAVANLVDGALPAGVELRDLGSVRLRDLASPERLFQVEHPSLRSEFPALRSLESSPNNLPQQATTFIGREREIAEIKKAFGATRLLTLLGAGGIGKTRLSLHVAADVLEHYPDGVWFVELAPLTDERLVPQAVASVLGVKEVASRPLTEALARHVADRYLLLVLDNCEHVVQSCATLADLLLRSGAHVRILVSSREPLRIPGEVIFPVLALALCPPRESIRAEDLLRFPASQLFAERAAAGQPGFRLTDENAPSVAEICQRLDGIPLAIELAAARVRSLSLQDIAARLNDRFSLLMGGSRTALPRHQTLRALIDWSYDLLSEKERVLFRRLAVFTGGWTLEAMESVCADKEIAESGVLDLLFELVDKSLVMVVGEGGRYRLLETVRQYASGRLKQSGEGDSTRARHAAFYLAFVEEAAPELHGAAQASALQRLDLERENIMSAHAYFLQNDEDVEKDYRLVHAVKHYWFMRGQLNLGHRVSVEAVMTPKERTNTSARMKALFVAGQICGFMGRYAEAQRYLRESLEIARAVGDKDFTVVVLNNLGMAAIGQGDRLSARLHCEEAIALARQSGNKQRIVTASNALAQLHRLDGDLESAVHLYHQCEMLARELGNRDFIAVALLNLAIVATAQGFEQRAAAFLREVLDISHETGSKPAVQSVLDVSTGLAGIRGEWERAARFYGAAEYQTGITGIRRDAADQAFLEPLVERIQQALGPKLFAECEGAGRALPFQDTVNDVRGWLSRI
jgi:predicted ATPase/class 3 adenylate cyclase